jgi:hypothetical protein
VASKKEEKYIRPEGLTYRFVSWKKSKSRMTRIRMRQPAHKPIRLRKRNALKAEAEWRQPAPEGMVIHRRSKRIATSGVNPEERAKQGIRGYLAERIMYKALETFGFVADVDFDFQSSEQGGRLELGGIVADFMFFYRRLIIQIQGPTHNTYLRFRKDEEQKDALSDKGFSVLEIDESDVLDAGALDIWIRRNLGTNRGGVGSTYRTL